MPFTRAFDGDGGSQPYLPPSSGTGNGFPILDWNQAAAQLTRDGASWSAVHGTPVTVTYAFRATGVANPGLGVSGFQVFNPTQIAVAEEALRLWSEVANITFVRVMGSGGSAYSNNATILFGNFVNGGAAFSAFTYLPDPLQTAASSFEGDVWVNISRDYDADPASFPQGARILAHEIGHALGLDHPGDYDGGAQSGVTYPTDADIWQDTAMFSNMSYFSESFTGGTFGVMAFAPQMLDIAAAQLLYGANMTTRTGDTVYGFNSNAGHAVFSITQGAQAATFCIWDAGGNDTLDLSGYFLPSQIDLREESFSSAGPAGGGAFGAIYNISIARGAVIENAIGGAGDDAITGNAANNLITGNAGNDTIDGGSGRDTSNYAASSGATTWHRNPDGSWTVSNASTGIDQVRNVEFLHFTDRDVFLDRAYSTFSGDGTSDILMRHDDGTLGAWFVNAGGVTGAAGIGVLDPAWTLEGVADFNGDGRDDLVMRNANGNLGAWFMNGGAASGAAGLGNVDLTWDVAGLGDLNGDGRDDILWWNANGSLGVWFMAANGATGSAGLGNISQSAWDIEALGDFNGDGRDDILWRNTTGDVGVWFMNGGTATGAGLGNIAPSWAIEGTGDFNGDGRDDILMRDAGGNVGIWFMNGASATGAGIGNVDHSFSVAAIGDYNGDGRDDILWWNDNGAVSAWFMNGASATAISYGNVGHDWIINPGG